jgi:hypothetical protein
MADESRNPLLRLCGDLMVWAKELPEAARLGLNDDGRTVEMQGVSFEMRHKLKLLAQRAGVDNAGNIEAVLYLGLLKRGAKEWAIDGSSRHFHGKRIDRTAYRGSAKMEGNQIVGYIYPLRDALLEYCSEMRGSDNDDSARAETAECLARLSEISAAAPTPAAPSRASSPAPRAAEVRAPAESNAEVSRRKGLLADYKSGAGNPANKRIYEARNSGIHKPQFYSWMRGELPADSGTCLNFERFLREKKPPIPRKPRD